MCSRDGEVYAGPSGDEGLDLAKALEAVQERAGAEIVVAAPMRGDLRIAGVTSAAAGEHVDALTRARRGAKLGRGIGAGTGVPPAASRTPSSVGRH